MVNVQLVPGHSTTGSGHSASTSGLCRGVVFVERDINIFILFTYTAQTWHSFWRKFKVFQQRVLYGGGTLVLQANIKVAVTEMSHLHFKTRPNYLT